MTEPNIFHTANSLVAELSRARYLLREAEPLAVEAFAERHMQHVEWERETKSWACGYCGCDLGSNPHILSAHRPDCSIAIAGQAVLDIRAFLQTPAP